MIKTFLETFSEQLSNILETIDVWKIIISSYMLFLRKPLAAALIHTCLNEHPNVLWSVTDIAVNSIYVITIKICRKYC